MERFTIVQGKLFKKIRHNNKDILRLCLPKELVLKVLFAYHGSPHGGSHLGFLKTYDKISARYNWPGMKNDVSEYVKSCQECQTRKYPLLPKGGLLHPIKVVNPFDLVGLDHLSPFKKVKTVTNTLFVPPII